MVQITQKYHAFGLYIGFFIVKTHNYSNPFFDLSEN